MVATVVGTVVIIGGVVVILVVGGVVVEPTTVGAGVEVGGTGVVVIEVVGEGCRWGCFWSSWFCCRAIHFLTALHLYLIVITYAAVLIFVFTY